MKTTNLAYYWFIKYRTPIEGDFLRKPFSNGNWEGQHKILGNRINCLVIFPSLFFYLQSFLSTVKFLQMSM